MKLRTKLIVIIPSVFTWLLATLLVLIYSFDIINYIESSANNPFAGLGALLLILILILVIFVIYYTGVKLDQEPRYLRTSILIGMSGSSLSVIFFVFVLQEGLFLIIGLASLAFFFSLLLTSSGTLFAGLSDMWKRGRIYSYIIFSFIILGIVAILFGGGYSSRFNDTEYLSHSFVSILSIVGIFGILLTICFYLLTRNMLSWKNDKWPTRFHKIINRRSVRAYLSTHILLYTMLGIVLASFSQLGAEVLNISWIIEIPSVGEFDLPIDKSFWFIVLVGDLLAILPAGYFTDRFGRKNLIVVAIYGIVFASLIFGLEKTPNSFIVAALSIGVSFSFLHPTLDSSLWADLSPRDGLGRYYAMGFISLVVGLGIGYIIGYWILPPEIENVEIITYLITILAILAAFPLFWVSDSYKPLDFTLLLVIEEGGLPIFDYSFQKIDISTELTLLSGALTAVASFMNETMKEKGDLNLVRHGNHFILTDKEKNTGVSAALFSNKQDPELQRTLTEFLTRFCKTYSKELKTWNGTRSVFDGAINIAEEVFGHLAPSTNPEMI